MNEDVQYSMQWASALIAAQKTVVRLGKSLAEKAFHCSAHSWVQEMTILLNYVDNPLLMTRAHQKMLVKDVWRTSHPIERHSDLIKLP